MSSLDNLHIPESYWYRYLVEPLFPVKLPDNLSLNPRWLEKMGYDITGDPREDARAKNRTVSSSLCIMDIVEYIDNGIGVAIAGKDDKERTEYIRLMHEYVTGYLGEWRDIINGRGFGRALEEMSHILRALDRFNRGLYVRLSLEEHERNLTSQAANFGIVKFDFRGTLTGKRQEALADYKEKYADISRMIFERQERDRD